MEFLAVIFLAVHAIISGVSLLDLVSVSQRPHKSQWAMMLLLLPIVSVILYHRSKKRNKPHNG